MESRDPGGFPCVQRDPAAESERDSPRSSSFSAERARALTTSRPTRLGRDLQFFIDTSTSDTGSKTGWEYGVFGWYNIGFPENSVIGYDMLAPFVLRLDYGNQRLWLRRVTQDPIRFSGADVAAFREVGAMLIPKDNRFHAWIVRPDGIAAQRGLHPGGWIEGMTSAEAIVKALREGEDLTLVRTTDGVGVDTVLEAVEKPTAVSAPPRGP